MKFTIFKRLTFGYIAIMVMVVFLGAQATFWLNQLNGITRDITAFHGKTIRLTERLIKDLFSLIGFEKKYIVSKDPDFYKQFWEINDNLEKDMLALASLMNVPEKKKLYQEAETLFKRYGTQQKETVLCMAESLGHIWHLRYGISEENSS